MEEVDRVLDRRRVAVVVLRQDHHERVRAVDACTPILGVLLGVLAQARVVGLVEERQLDLGEVRHVKLKHAMGLRTADEPLADRQANPAGAG